MGYKRIIITDMDDSMIKAYGKVTKAIRDLWNKLSKDENVCLVVATGQQFMKVKSTFLANGLAIPDYIISDQGTVIYCTKENKILTTFWLPSEDVVVIYEEFFKLGGEDGFVRIYTPETIFAYDCEMARDFFTKTNQKNVLYGRNLRHIIQNGAYTKVIMMNTVDKVDELVLHSMNSNTLMAVNTGETKYGNCHYHRFEITSSNKKVALEYLLAHVCGFPNNEEPIDILCIGDEKSDFGLAQVAMATNLYPENQGKFAIICNNTKGNVQLKEDCEILAKSIGYQEKIILAPDVNSDGWKVAVEDWYK